jgi:hypothetical protein
MQYQVSYNLYSILHVIILLSINVNNAQTCKKTITDANHGSPISDLIRLYEVENELWMQYRDISIN